MGSFVILVFVLHSILLQTGKRTLHFGFHVTPSESRLLGSRVPLLF
eukprot:NODE_17844_length_173_cov_27.056452_g16074_i0.p2 GENE.NODE_17844_length_173_cov_27.056452_g16074_i0~~NODE_17844_length_173_cov_27.056452_g16074_i0.p2  ORF type:complete len:53 (+),score=8.92 NODE_17844_length_173_cov_27.056452_g16074_i0:24-161(+)